MLKPDYLLHLSEGAEEIAAQLHTDMMKRIVSRIMEREKRGYDYLLTASDKWRIESMIEAGYLREDLIQDIAKATNREQTEIKEAFEDAGVKSMDYDNEIYQAAGIETQSLQQSPYAIRLMQRNYEATMGLWKNFTGTTADAAQQVFINQMDTIYNRVMFGGIGYIEAFTEGINELAKTGITVVYPSGHRDTIETATLRCVRTGISQATAQMQIARMDEYGVDLVLVSSHMGARPTHQVWQGKIYKRGGRYRKYPDFVSSTGYGTGEGLCGWNCRHSFSPYFEGMGNPFERYDDPENVKLYEDTQKQRQMERGIRKTKRETEVLSEAARNAPNGELKDNLNSSIAKARERLKRQNKAYQEFCEEHDLRPLPERLKIAKASRAERKAAEPVAPTKPVEKPKVPEPEKTFADKMQEIRERVKANGKATDSDLHEAGKLVKEELTKANAGKDAMREQVYQLLDKRAELDLKITELSDRIQDIIDQQMGDEFDSFKAIMLGQSEEIDALQQQIDAILNSDEYKGLSGKIDELKAKIQSNAHSNADTLKGILSQFREMGHEAFEAGVKSKTPTAAVLKDALNYYPKEWVQYAIDSGGITVRKVSRGYCNSWDNLIALSGWGDDDTFSTAVHELGHYFERKVSVSDTYVPYSSAKHYPYHYLKQYYPEGQSYILDAERDFYKRRTQGETLQWLGVGYDKNEVTRKDKFIHKYMGKDYGGTDFELVSMGFQYAYTDPATLAKDPDMEEWIYGILSLF